MKHQFNQIFLNFALKDFHLYSFPLIMFSTLEVTFGPGVFEKLENINGQSNSNFNWFHCIYIHRKVVFKISIA